MDPIAAMLGLEIADEEKTRALSDALRGQKRAADFFGHSTVAPIAQGAQQASADALSSAKTAGGLRRAMQDREAQDERSRLQRELTASEGLAGRQNTAALQEARLLQQASEAQLGRDATLAATEAQNRERGFETWIDPKDPTRTVNARMVNGDLVTSTGGNADIRGMIPIGNYDAPDAAATLYEKPATRAEREKFEKGDTDALALRGLQQSWKEEYLPPPLTGLIGGGKIRNALANYMPILTDKDSEDSARWWKDYQRQAELVQRHEMFGSALTKSEQAAWEAANIDPSIADPKTIRDALSKRADLAQKIAERQAFTAMKNGYDPELIETNFGSTVDVPAMFADDGAAYLERLRERQEIDRKWQMNQTGAGADSLPDIPLPDYDINALDDEAAIRKAEELGL